MPSPMLDAGYRETSIKKRALTITAWGDSEFENKELATENVLSSAWGGQMDALGEGYKPEPHMSGAS